jgi:hypothetical protein
MSQFIVSRRLKTSYAQAILNSTRTEQESIMRFTVGDIAIPDSQLAREITELVRDTESPLLFHHSSRVYYWAALTGQRRGLHYDAELLYAGAMFHDMGLMPAHSSHDKRFEVDGANVAADFLRSRGIGERDVEKVWTAIALHTTPGIPEFMAPEIALVTAGVEMDVLGIRYDNFADAGAPAPRALQGRHHRGVLQRHPTQARHHVWQRQGRCHRRQGAAFPSRQFLQRDPAIGLERLMHQAAAARYQRT